MCASKRNYTRREDQTLTPWLNNPFEFPKEKDGVIYVRQSSLVQVKKNVHSFEMQTDRFLEHFRNIGCTGNIEIIPDDEGMSGALDIHERPGMSRMMKMIESESISWVAAVHVNRFFRDQWMINPDVFIKECHNHNVIVATLNQTFNFRDSYSQRIFRIEAEEAARFLATMKLILGGGKLAASDHGYYDGRTLSIGYIVDRSDLKHKKYIIYEPHAVGVRWLFRRYFELDGNVMNLCREIEKMPFLFPKFENWVDPKDVRRTIQAKTESGDYLPSATGIRLILCNPAYIGAWVPLNGGIIENNHEPIVDEGLFMYAFNRLSSFDLQGNRQKPEAITRFGQGELILKKVSKDIRGKAIRCSVEKGGMYRSIEQLRLSFITHFTLVSRFVDSMFLARLFARIRSLPEVCTGWEDILEKKQISRDMQSQLIKKGLREIAERMDRLAELLADTSTPLPETLKRRYIEDYAGLEAKRKKLEADIQEKTDEDNDEEIIFEIATLVPEIIMEWEALPFHERLRFVGALAQEVIIDVPSPGWLKMVIVWKLSEWGIDVGHIRKEINNGSTWTEEEQETLERLYPTEDAAVVLAALPRRTWKSIKVRASDQGIVRLRNTHNSIKLYKTVYDATTMEDFTYAQKHNLDPDDEDAQWENIVVDPNDDDTNTVDSIGNSGTESWLAAKRSGRWASSSSRSARRSAARPHPWARSSPRGHSRAWEAHY